MSNPEIVEINKDSCIGCAVCSVCAGCAITVVTAPALAVGVDGVAFTATLI